MKIIRMHIDPLAAHADTGRVDFARVDATTEQEINHQQAMDEQDARHDAARFARRVRQRLGLTQAKFA